MDNVWEFIEDIRKKGFKITIEGFYDEDDLDDGDSYARYYSPEDVGGVIEKHVERVVEAMLKSASTGAFETFCYDGSPVLSVTWSVKVEREKDHEHGSSH